jgi:uncharacterized protein (TIGR00369 family)
MDIRNIADMTSGFREMLGIRFVGVEDDAVVLDMMIGPEHLNTDGVLHGGVLASLIDMACGVVIAQPLPGGTVRKAVTLSLTTSFTGQGKSGLVRAIGRRRAGGRRIVFASAEVVDAYGNLLAFGEGSFRYRSTPE